MFSHLRAPGDFNESRLQNVHLTVDVDICNVYFAQKEMIKEIVLYAGSDIGERCWETKTCFMMALIIGAMKLRKAITGVSAQMDISVWRDPVFRACMGIDKRDAISRHVAYITFTIANVCSLSSTV